jgi:hypothetical protein
MAKGIVEMTFRLGIEADNDMEAQTSGLKVAEAISTLFGPEADLTVNGQVLHDDGRLWFEIQQDEGGK